MKGETFLETFDEMEQQKRIEEASESINLAIGKTLIQCLFDFEHTHGGLFDFQTYSRWFVRLSNILTVVCSTVEHTHGGLFDFRTYSRWFVRLSNILTVVCSTVEHTHGGLFDCRTYSRWFVRLSNILTVVCSTFEHTHGGLFDFRTYSRWFVWLSNIYPRWFVRLSNVIWHFIIVFRVLVALQTSRPVAPVQVQVGVNIPRLDQGQQGLIKVGIARLLGLPEPSPLRGDLVHRHQNSRIIIKAASIDPY